MSASIDVHSLGLVDFGDDLGSPVSTGPGVDEDAWWPWVLVVLAAGLVVLGAICFTPDQEPRQGPCPTTSCPSTPADGYGAS